MSRCQQSRFVSSLWSLRPDPYRLDLLTLHRSLWNTSAACRAWLTTPYHNFGILWLIKTTICHLVMPRLYPMPEAFGLHDNWISVKRENCWIIWEKQRKAYTDPTVVKTSLKATSRALKRRHPAHYSSSLTNSHLRIQESISISFSKRKTRATRC